MNRLLMFVFSRRAVLRNDLSRSEIHAVRLNNVFVFCLFFCPLGCVQRELKL